MTCALYRHFDADGQLLYVGISEHPFSRLDQHVGQSHWSRSIVRVEIEWLENREAAVEAERNAIQGERPKHNILHAVNNEASELIFAIGEDVLKEKLGINDRLIRHMRSSGKISGLWFKQFALLCEPRGIDCPTSAFFWKGPENYQPKQSTEATA